MIPILIVYLIIALFEWRSLIQKYEQKRPLIVIMVFIALTMLTAEALYMSQDSFHLAELIRDLFSPLEQAIAGSRP